MSFININNRLPRTNIYVIIWEKDPIEASNVTIRGASYNIKFRLCSTNNHWLVFCFNQLLYGTTTSHINPKIYLVTTQNLYTTNQTKSIIIIIDFDCCCTNVTTHIYHTFSLVITNIYFSFANLRYSVVHNEDFSRSVQDTTALTC